MRRVAVAGVGMTKFGPSKKSQVEMFAEAAMEAINGSHIRGRGRPGTVPGQCAGRFRGGPDEYRPLLRQ